MEGQRAERAATNSSLNLESIHPNYFATFGVVLVRGRAFTRDDRQGAPNVVIVSEDVAARTWPGGDAIGKRVKLGGANSPQPWREVVGVARRTRYRELREPRATLYLPASQFMFTPDMIVLRTGSPTGAVAAIVRDRVRTVDPAVEVMRIARFAELLEGPLARPRFNAFLIGVFGVAAWLLAAIGLYALMGASVRQRYTEIGMAGSGVDGGGGIVAGRRSGAGVVSAGATSYEGRSWDHASRGLTHRQLLRSYAVGPPADRAAVTRGSEDPERGLPRADVRAERDARELHSP